MANIQNFLKITGVIDIFQKNISFLSFMRKQPRKFQVFHFRIERNYNYLCAIQEICVPLQVEKKENGVYCNFRKNG